VTATASRQLEYLYVGNIAGKLRIRKGILQEGTILCLSYMKVTVNGARGCPVETTLAVIGGKWKPLILWHLGEGGVHRFLDLQRLIPGITRKMLTQHLRELERDGIVVRAVFNELPLRVEYSLTKYGSTLRPILRALCHWGSEHEVRTKSGTNRTAPAASPKRQPSRRLVPAIG
jgi:DNA-binding HxlR family transcriptional regulator